MLRPGTRAATILLGSLTGMAPFATSMFMPSLPDIMRTFSVTAVEVQLSITAYLFGLAIGQIFYGPIADRYGRKPVLLGAMAIFCAATVVCAISPTIEILILGRALQAIGGAGSIVVTRAIVRDTYEGAQAAREFAILGSFMSVSPIVAPIIGGLLQAAFGWRSTFVTLLGLAAILLVIVVVVLPETLKQRSTEPLSLTATFRTFGTFLRDPGYLANVALGAGAFAGGYAWLSGSAFILQDLHDVSVVEFSFLFALSSVGFLIGNTIASRLVMKKGIHFTIIVGAFVLALASVMLLGAMALEDHNVAFMVGPATLFLAGMGLVMPQSLASALMKFPRNAGAASSLAGFIQQGAGGISAAIVGYFMAKTEWPVVLGIASMGLFVLFVCLTTRGIRTAGHQSGS